MDRNTKMTDAEKLAQIKEFKEKGNTFHKAGNYKKAAGSYHRAILYIKALSSNCPNMSDLMNMSASDGAFLEEKISEEMLTESKRLTCDCYNNLAACMLKEPDPKYDRIIEHCNKALEASPSNGKALFRKGISLHALGQYSEALAELERAPSGPEVRRYMELCKAGVKQQDRELADLYKGMFKS